MIYVSIGKFSFYNEYFYEFPFQNKITLNSQFEAFLSAAYINLSYVLDLGLFFHFKYFDLKMAFLLSSLSMYVLGIHVSSSHWSETAEFQTSSYCGHKGHCTLRIGFATNSVTSYVALIVNVSGFQVILLKIKDLHE